MSAFIRADRWNRRMVDRLADVSPLPGANIQITQTPRGRIVSMSERAMWAHPWAARPRWNRSDQIWETTIKAGFVNGYDPLIRGLGEAGEDLYLANAPTIKLGAMRTVGGPGDAVPPFFLALGVRKPSADVSISATGSVVIDVTARMVPELPPRILMAVDFVLVISRPAVRLDVYEADSTGFSGVAIDYQAIYETENLQRNGARARLLQMPKFTPPASPTLYERLLGDYQDAGEDRMRICTIYLLSPPNELEPKPNGAWRAYVQHEVFWNLSHATKNLAPPEQPAPVRLSTGLALGLGDVIGNNMLSSINDFSDRAANALNATETDGQFWSI